MNVSSHLRQHLDQGSQPTSDLDAARRQGLEEALALLNDAGVPPEGESADFARGWRDALGLIRGWLDAARGDA
jgi:hypothetical protein